MSHREPVNILLVDDQPAKLLSYEMILADLGENLIRASSGKEALEYLLKKDIAVVLVDVCMPELDGFELAKMIHNHPRFHKTAIILVSAVMVNDADRLKGYGSGAVDYVSVPIVPEILRAKVQVFAELFQKTEELQRLNRELEQRVADRTSEIRAALDQAEHARQDAEKANRLKDEFLATLSHELRTPLSAITGWAHMLQVGGLDPATQKKALETISRNARLQTQLISDILDVSSIITGKLRLSREKLNLPAAIQSVLDTFMPAAEAKGIRLEASFSNREEFISGDPARLQQVIWNLLSNAIKFAPRNGHVWIRVEAAGSLIEIVVEDDGPGIGVEFLPFIFDRFRQADSSSTRHHHGLGLGLAIAKHLVELHGGRIQASNRDRGTGGVFRILLPRQVPAIEVPSEGDDPRRSPLPEPLWLEAAPSLSGLRVLVVDDEVDSREVIAAMLERCGAETSIAASADDALTLIRRNPPDVLVADIEMPGGDGYSLLQRVRALPADEGGLVPAIALTAYASGQDRLKALGAGFLMHLSKPAQPVELARAVAAVAESRSIGHAEGTASVV